MSDKKQKIDEDAFRRAFMEGFEGIDAGETDDQKRRDPELGDAPLELGVMRDVVGHVPAGPGNCDIYYTETSEGEAIAAVTLLTQKMMPQPVIAHLNAINTNFVCTATLNDLGMQIFDNLKDGRPPTEIRGRDEDAENRGHDDALGLASKGSRTLLIQRETRNQVIEKLADGFASLASQLFAMDDVSEEEPPDVAEEDHLYQDINLHGIPTTELRLQDVVDAGDDRVQLAALMRRVQAAPELNEVPMTVCHEIGHIGKIQRVLMPEFDNPRPMAAVFAQIAFSGDTFMPELATAQALPKEDRNALGYYLRDPEEATAQMIGESVMHVIEDTSGVPMLQPGLSRVMPRTAKHYQQAIRDLTPPKIKAQPAHGVGAGDEPAGFAP